MVRFLGASLGTVAQNKDEHWMREALAAANEGLAAGELPIGAVAFAEG